MEEKIESIYKMGIAIIVLVCISLLFSFISLINSNNNTSSSNNNNTNTETEENSDYDVSMFKELNLSQVLKLFNDKNNNYVVYFGRPTCSACVSFLPTLQNIQKKYGFTTMYMDITNVDAKSDDFEKLMKKMNKTITLTVSGEEMTQEFGDYYGYTPMVFVIKKGKFVDGFVGAYSETKFESFLSKNGIKKNS